MHIANKGRVGCAQSTRERTDWTGVEGKHAAIHGNLYGNTLTYTTKTHYTKLS